MTAPSVVPGRGTPERELDALIAEKLFGWLWLYRFGHRWFGPPETVGETDPLYGTVWAWDAATFGDAEVEDAWWLRDVAASSDSPVVPHYSTDIAVAWQVVERLREMRRGEAEMQQVFRLAHCYPAGVVAQAICRAALLAVASSGVPSSVVLAVDPSWSTPAPAAVAPTSSVPSRDAGGADR